MLVPQWGPGGGYHDAIAWIGTDAIVALGRDVVVVDATTGTIRARSEASGSLVAATRDAIVTVEARWDLATDTTTAFAHGVVGLTADGVLIRDGEELAIAAADGTSPRSLGRCTDVVWHPAAHAIVCRSGADLRLVSTSEASTVATLHARDGQAFSPDGTTLVLSDGPVLVGVDVATGAERFRTAPDPVVVCSYGLRVVLAAAAPVAAASCVDRDQVTLLDTTSGVVRTQVSLAGMAHPRSVAVSADGTYLAVGHEGGTRILRVVDGATVTDVAEGHAAFAPTGALLAVASEHGVRVVDATDGRETTPAATSLAPRSSIDEGRTWDSYGPSAGIVVATSDGFAVVDPATAPRAVRSCGHPLGATRDAVIAEHGLWVGGDACQPIPEPLRGADATLETFVGGSPIVSMRRDGSRAELAASAARIALAEDGSVVLLATDRAIDRYDTRTGRRLAHRVVTEAASIVVSGHGAIATQVTGSGLWVLDAQLRTITEIHTTRASVPAISPDETLVAAAVDGTRLVLASTDGTVREAALTRAHLHTDVSFAAEGTRLVVAQEDDRVRPPRMLVEVREAASPEVVVTALEGRLARVSPDGAHAIVVDDGRAVAVDLASGDRTELGPCTSAILPLDALGLVWLGQHALARLADGARLRLELLDAGDGAMAALWLDASGAWELSGATGAPPIVRRRSGAVLTGTMANTASTPGLAAAFVAAR